MQINPSHNKSIKLINSTTYTETTDLLALSANIVAV